MKFVYFFCTVLFLSQLTMVASALAQNVLPKGVILFQYGYRYFNSPTSWYDENGKYGTLGERYSRPLTGPELVNGNGGSQMQELASEIKKYDGTNEGEDSLSQRLYLGKINGEVTGKVKTHIFGCAYGINDRFTFFAGIPWINVNVNADVSYNGTGNNALAIKDELGDIAFDELKDGLDRAAKIDNAQVQEQIASYQYRSLGKWEKSAFGDLRLGLRGEWKRPVSNELQYILSPSILGMVPTGYTENPDVLQDIDFGKGYYGLGASLDQRLYFFNLWELGFHTLFMKNLPTTLEKRVPEGKELLVPSERKAKAKLTPGDDTDLAVSAGFRRQYILAEYRFGVARHFGDRYSGDLSGDYGTLAANSDTYQQYQRIILEFETYRAFQQKKFFLPFILTLTANFPRQAQNMMDDKYYELTVASFLPTPWMDNTEIQHNEKQAKTEKKRKSK